MKKVAKVVLFIVLKVLEIGAIVYVPYWLGLLWNLWLDFPEMSPFDYWGIGLSFTALLIGVCVCALAIIIFGIPYFIKANIRLVNKILD